MKKYDFLPSTAQWREKTPYFFLQDFCKNAQWRAKKLRERGSNTARPTEKGVGGLPIGARPVDFGASVVPTPCRHPADTLPTPCRQPADNLQTTLPTPCRQPADHLPTPCRQPCRHTADTLPTHCRQPADTLPTTLPTPCRHPADTLQTPKTRHKKSPIPQSGNRAVAIARRRALLTFC